MAYTYQLIELNETTIIEQDTQLKTVKITNNWMDNSFHTSSGFTVDAPIISFKIPNLINDENFGTQYVVLDMIKNEFDQDAVVGLMLTKGKASDLSLGFYSITHSQLVTKFNKYPSYIFNINDIVTVINNGDDAYLYKNGIFVAKLNEACSNASGTNVTNLGKKLGIVTCDVPIVTYTNVSFTEEITIENVKIVNNDIVYNAYSTIMGIQGLKHFVKVDNGEYYEFTPLSTGGNAFKYSLNTIPTGVHTITLKCTNELTEGFSPMIFANIIEAVVYPEKRNNYITIYKKNESNFATNGLEILKGCSDGYVEEGLNGNCILEINSIISPNMKTGNYIKVNVDDTRNAQIFKIKNIRRGFETANIFCKHILLDKLSSNYLGVDIVGEYTLNEVLTAILSNTIIQHDILLDCESGTTAVQVDIKKGKLSKVILEDIPNFFECIFKFDNNKLYVNPTINTNSITAQQGKNVIEIEEEIDEIDICTVLIPFSSDGIGIQEKTVASPILPLYSDIYCLEYTFSNICIDEASPTTALVRERLKKASQELFENERIDIPRFNYKIDIKEKLGNEFDKNVNLGEEIPCIIKNINLNTTATIIKRRYNILTKENETIELGFKRKSLAEVFGKKQVDNLIKTQYNLTTKQYVQNVVSANATTQKISYIEQNNELDYKIAMLELGL